MDWKRDLSRFLGVGRKRALPLSQVSFEALDYDEGLERLDGQRARVLVSCIIPFRGGKMAKRVRRVSLEALSIARSRSRFRGNNVRRPSSRDPLTRRRKELSSVVAKERTTLYGHSSSRDLRFFHFRQRRRVGFDSSVAALSPASDSCSIREFR